MTPLLVVFPNPQRPPQLLTLLDLRLSQLVHLMALQTLRVGSTSTALLLRFELLS